MNTAWVLAEALYGVASHSLAVLADTGHNLGDVLGGRRMERVGARQAPARRAHTYGLRRTSTLAAFGNAVVLLVDTGGCSSLNRPAEQPPWRSPPPASR